MRVTRLVKEIERINNEIFTTTQSDIGCNNKLEEIEDYYLEMHQYIQQLKKTLRKNDLDV